MLKKEMNEKQEEILLKLSLYEEQINNLNQQLKAIDETIIELANLSFCLDEIKKFVGKEILSQIGRGIYLKTELKSDELIVNVGDKKLVKKNIEDTKKIIEEQVIKLESIKKEINESLLKINQEISKIIGE